MSPCPEKPIPPGEPSKEREQLNTEQDAKQFALIGSFAIADRLMAYCSRSRLGEFLLERPGGLSSVPFLPAGMESE